MPVPTSMSDLSATESSNSPAGSDAISTSLDNYLRAIQAIVRSTNFKGPDIASAASVAIGASPGEFLTVTGTTTITSFDSISAGIVRTVLFSGALTITHSSNIQLPGDVNYTTTAGDVLIFRSLGSGQWKCVAAPKVIDEATAAEAYTQDNSASVMTTRRLRDINYAGVVTFNGSAWVLTVSSASASGWSVSSPATGTYLITHNLGLSSNFYNLIVNPVSIGSGSTIIASWAFNDANSFYVYLKSNSGSAVSNSFSFTAMRVAT